MYMRLPLLYITGLPSFYPFWIDSSSPISGLVSVNRPDLQVLLKKEMQHRLIERGNISSELDFGSLCRLGQARKKPWWGLTNRPISSAGSAWSLRGIKHQSVHQILQLGQEQKKICPISSRLFNRDSHKGMYNHSIIEGTRYNHV